MAISQEKFNSNIFYFLIYFGAKENKMLKKIEFPSPEGPTFVTLIPGNCDLNKINNFQQEVNILIFLTGLI